MRHQRPKLHTRIPARLAASAVLALSLTAGVAATTAPVASAEVGKSACTQRVGWSTVLTTAAVKFRTGPSIHAVAKGQLDNDEAS